MEEKENLLRQVNEALDSIRPHLYTDGGDIEVVDITPEGKVFIRWKGNCENCNMSAMTMRGGVEYAIKTKVQGIVSVEAVN